MVEKYPGITWHLIYPDGHLFVTRVEYSKNIPDKQSTVAHNKYQPPKCRSQFIRFCVPRPLSFLASSMIDILSVQMKLCEGARGQIMDVADHILASNYF